MLTCSGLITKIRQRTRRPTSRNPRLSSTSVRALERKTLLAQEKDNQNPNPWIPSITITNKLERIGSCETVSSLKDFLRQLRGNDCDQLGASLENSGHTFNTPGKLLTLKNGIEFNETNEYRSKGLRRLYLAELIGEYWRARAIAQQGAVSPDIRSTPHRKGCGIVEKITGKPAKRLASSVIARFLDCLFPETAESVTCERTESAKKARTEAARKFEKWRVLEKPLLRLIAQFGTGIVLLVPNDLSNEE